ncbi:MAG: FAD-binding oxidoreductase [Legionellaceae bacterium]
MSLYQRIIAQLPALGQTTPHAAAIIDKAYLEESNHLIGYAWRFVKIRIIYAGYFLPLVVVDLFSSLIPAIAYAGVSLLSSDEVQTYQLAQQKKYALLFSKNIYAILGSFVGLISPKMVAFHFISKDTARKGVGAGGRYYHAENVELRMPDTIEDLQEIIREAKRKNFKIVPIGSGRSQGRQFLAEGGDGAIVIDLQNMNTIQINAKNKTAIVGAGVRWEELQVDANKHKLALSVMQASPIFSVGGSIGINCHGWDHITGSLVETIISMDIINADGELQTVTAHDPLFHYIVGGLGLFGIVVSAEIQLTNNELLTEKGTTIAIKDYVKYFHDEIQTNDTIKMHLYRLSLDPKGLLNHGIAVSFIKENGDTPVKTNHLTIEDTNGTRFFQQAVNLIRRSSWLRSVYWNVLRSELLANDRPATTRNKIMQDPVKWLFNESVSESEWLQEYFVPERHLETFIAGLATILMENNVVLVNASVRFVKKHEQSPLSYTCDGDRFAIVICFNQSLQASCLIQAKKWLRQAQLLAIHFEGTFYLCYQDIFSREAFEAAYPHANKAQEMKDRVDPNHLFSSGFYQKYLSTRPAIQSDLFTTEASPVENNNAVNVILDKYLPSLDKKSVVTLLKDVMAYNDTPREIIDELCQRLPEIMSIFALNQSIKIKQVHVALLKLLDVEKPHAMGSTQLLLQYLGGAKQNSGIDHVQPTPGSYVANACRAAPPSETRSETQLNHSVILSKLG